MTGHTTRNYVGRDQPGERGRENAGNRGTRREGNLGHHRTVTCPLVRTLVCVVKMQSTSAPGVRNRGTAVRNVRGRTGASTNSTATTKMPD